MNTSFISTNQLKDLINEQKFTSTQDIMECMKGMFTDVLEQTLQAELDQHLGYDHSERQPQESRKNYRNGSVKRTMKTQLGEVDIYVTVIVMVILKLKLLVNINVMQVVSKNVLYHYMQQVCILEISKIKSKDFTM